MFDEQYFDGNVSVETGLFFQKLIVSNQLYFVYLTTNSVLNYL